MLGSCVTRDGGPGRSSKERAVFVSCVALKCLVAAPTSAPMQTGRSQLQGARRVGARRNSGMLERCSDERATVMWLVAAQRSAPSLCHTLL